uniref:Uncharacterized protein n=1 Tax=Anguilla anguilla TaxID=7936 RepID=A0A0E9SPY9_ANGAN
MVQCVYSVLGRAPNGSLPSEMSCSNVIRGGQIFIFLTHTLPPLTQRA